MAILIVEKIVLESVHFKKTVVQFSFLSKVLSFSLKSKQSQQKNEDCTTAFLKWTLASPLLFIHFGSYKNKLYLNKCSVTDSLCRGRYRRLRTLVRNMKPRAAVTSLSDFYIESWDGLGQIGLIILAEQDWCIEWPGNLCTIERLKLKKME